MFTHADIWAAIDALAREHNLTASALARRARLDPTAFNKSKRTTREGKPRWPSTESIAKVLEATGVSLEAFVAHIAGSPRTGAMLPLAGLEQVGLPGMLDGDLRPAGEGWDAIPPPCADHPHAWAVEVAGDALRPLYRDGDVIVVSPAAGIRRGDRVLVKTADGAVLVAQLARRSARRVELAPPDGGAARVLAAEEVAWIVRIVWASQ